MPDLSWRSTRRHRRKPVCCRLEAGQSRDLRAARVRRVPRLPSHMNRQLESGRCVNGRLPLAILCCAFVAACSGGGQAASTDGTDTSSPGCSGSCATAATALAVVDVQRVLAQGIAEAQARNANATIAVVDRVGNVLAVYRMGAAASRKVVIASSISQGNAVVSGGLEGIQLPVAAAPLANIDQAAAISKAVTGAYLSTEGNAFSTRTASQIVQQHFNVGELHQPAGPLFGVQFSQLACSGLHALVQWCGSGCRPATVPTRPVRRSRWLSPVQERHGGRRRGRHRRWVVFDRREHHRPGTATSMN